MQYLKCNFILLHIVLNIHIVGVWIYWLRIENSYQTTKKYVYIQYQLTYISLFYAQVHHQKRSWDNDTILLFILYHCVHVNGSNIHVVWTDFDFAIKDITT